MGLLDGNIYGGGLLDPNTASMLGFAAGIGQASGPSRLPISMGQAFGGGIQGMLGGQREALQSNLLAQEAQKNYLGNALLTQRYGLMQDALNGTGMFGGGSPAGSPSPSEVSAIGQPGPSDLLRRAMVMEALVPGSGKTLLEKNTPGYQNLREGSALFSPTGQIVAQNPRTPPNTSLNQGPNGFSVSPIPGAYNAAAINAGIAEGAKVAGQKQIESFKTGLETGEPAGGGGPGLPNGATATPSQPIAVKPQTGEIATDRGTVVPSSFSNQKMGPGSDLINKQNTESINTEKNWATVRPTIETQRARLQVISNAFSDLETKDFTQARANIANALNGLGLKPAADMVMSQANVADVQRVLWAGMQDVMQQLKIANAGAGGRILRSEFEAYMDHAFSPDQVGPALRTAVTQQLGTMYQMGNMIDDYYGVGRQSGWRDANQFQSAYLKKNPIEGFVNYAENSVPQFKGPTPVYNEGQTATNPKTGARLIFRNGQWSPLQ